MANESSRKAVAKYHQKLDDIKVRVPKGEREKYKQYAESVGKSLNALIIELLEADMNKSASASEQSKSELASEQGKNVD